MPDLTPESTPQQVRQRRERMFEATRLLQECSQPPEGDPSRWRQELGDAVDTLDEVLAAHIASTEGRDGFFDQLIDESEGRLSSPVDGLRRDHGHSTELLRDLREAIQVEADPVTLQKSTNELIEQLEAHRHRGADLLWEAYGVEIGVID